MRKYGISVRIILDHVFCMADAIWILHAHSSSTTHMANRKTLEKVTANPNFVDGFIAGSKGYWADRNPHKANSFEWISWSAGWLRGREYYMDEGWWLQ